MLKNLVQALGNLAMSILIFIGVVVAGLAGVVLVAFWSSLQFIVLGAVAIIGVVFTISEIFRPKK